MRSLTKKILSKLSAEKQTSQNLKFLLESDWFDEGYYVKENDIPAENQLECLTRVGAIKHYLNHGVDLGFNPSAKFNTAWYLERYKDIRKSKINPLIHFLRYGVNEGRIPKPPLLEDLNNAGCNDKNPKITFYSTRSDGFGERIKSILNGLVLAEYFNCDFRFSWPASSHLGDSHSVASAKETFSDEFLAKYFVSDIPDDISNFDSVENLSGNGGTISLRVSQANIFNQFPFLQEKLSRDVFGKAFSSIDFSDEITSAINNAKSIEINSPSISVHLRSGDIVYGRYRFDDRYTNKVISYPQADFICGAANSDNYHVIIFGENQDVCRKLADRNNSSYFGDWAGLRNMTQLQKAIFDIVLMSRTDRIYAGNSGFSQLAEWIGRTPICSPDDNFNRHAMANHIIDVLESSVSESFDDFQNGFGSWHLVFNYKDIIGRSNAILHLEKALLYTPDCLFYHAVLASLYFESGAISKANHHLDILISSKPKPEGVGSYEYLTEYKYSDGKKPLHKYRGNMLAMSKNGVSKAGDVFRALAH
ncbi:MAG: hypothetical protein CL587_12060 [Alteromonadaceae bacterium]|nr:hypothetical protein [Alteromonadaceae bacterium]